VFAISDRPLDAAALRVMLEDPAAGAVLVFEGVVRNVHRERPVERLAYQAYTELAVAEGARIVEAAQRQFEILQVVCVHRVGELAIGEVAVFIGVAAAHRDAAYAANRFLIDEIKKTVPIWKKEFYADGESDWLHPTA